MKLNQIRREKGIKQQELADICGIQQSNISRFETGKRMPSIRIKIGK